jgi:catechol 2,3-dioxygenase-like lactoylglutathione lyase family enzyme
MLGSSKLIAFVPTLDSNRARQFYEGTLGLRFVSDDHFALVFDSNGVMVRITKVREFTPDPFTILGWEVADIEQAVKALTEKGVRFERYNGVQQDSLGIWNSPANARVAWFKDPDGNTLSVTQFQ